MNINLSFSAQRGLLCFTSSLAFLTLASAQEGSLEISEFLAFNGSGLRDLVGDSPDWIEIRNLTSETVSLDGFALTTDPDPGADDREAIWYFPDDTTIAANDYLIVFASGRDDETNGDLHADFQIDSRGGYLGLLSPSGETISEYPEYPEQRRDVSYGTSPDGLQTRYFKSPSPGAENLIGFTGFVAEPTVSIGRGFYEEPITITLLSETEGALFLYTLDGSAPSIGAPNARTYSNPITIDTTATLRAIAYLGTPELELEPSGVVTHTYIFVDDVVRQGPNPEGWPSDWGNEGQEPGHARVADYEMDPRVADTAIPDYGVREALLDLPTLSIVMDRDDFIGSINGIYTHPLSRRLYLEKASSIELIYPDGQNGFQIDGGVNIHGDASRDPLQTQKHSFKVSFTGQHGDTPLAFPLMPDSPVTQFDSLVFRAGFADSWALVSWDPERYRPNDSQYVRQVWMEKTLRDMGHYAPYSTFVHLYVNGLYWGLYNPTESVDAAQISRHQGGRANDYVVVIEDEGLNISDPYWAEASSLLADEGGGMNSPETFGNFVDLTNFTDFMLLHFFAHADHWPNQDYYAIRNRKRHAPFQLHIRDQEVVLATHATMNPYDPITTFPAKLLAEGAGSREFKLHFGDRARKHLARDGALSLEENQARYRQIADQLDKAIVAESARWGDTATSTPYGNPIEEPSIPPSVDDPNFPAPPHGPYYYFTREDSWLVERDHILNHYLPALSDDQNHQIGITNQLARANLYENYPVEFNESGGIVPTGFRLMIQASSTMGGNIIYTLDGSDPRLAPGEMSLTGTFYPPEGIRLADGLHTVKARFWASGIFSDDNFGPLTEATFVVGNSSSIEEVIISEIQYHPAAPSAEERAAGFTSADDFEYVELFNRGTHPVLLDGIIVGNGFTFAFQPDSPLRAIESRQRVLLVKDREAFKMRYGRGLPVAGEFAPLTGLSDTGEKLSLADQQREPWLNFIYGTSEPWPTEANGNGNSLVLIDSGEDADLNDPMAWRASLRPLGSPGREDSIPDETESFEDWLVIFVEWEDLNNLNWTGRTADPDDDGLPNLLEYAIGTHPLKHSPEAVPLATVVGERAANTAEITMQTRGDLELDVTAEISHDLVTWEKDSGDGSLIELKAREVTEDDWVKWTWQLPTSSGQSRGSVFVRIVVE